MQAKELMSNNILPLKLSDSGGHALVVMHEYNVSTLPLVDGKLYSGLISIDEVLNQKHLNLPLSSHPIDLRKPSVHDTAHIFDVMKVAYEHDVKIVPVVNDQNEYLGLVSAEVCLRAFARLNSVNEAGSIIEMDIKLKDFSMAEISRIVEESELMVLCFYTNVKQAEGKVEVTMKVNTTDVSMLVSAFERFEYEVKSVYNGDNYAEEVKDRYDALMRYLNV